MAKIDFFMLGQGKSGTTSLYNMFKRQPEIYVPAEKENGFFAYDNYAYGFPWYEFNIQKEYSDEQIVGDCFSGNLVSSEAPKRIYETFGTSPKFIVLMRNPVERALSHYKMAVRQFRETLTFEEALKQEASRTSQNKTFEVGLSYSNRGKYFHLINNYIELFPRENFLFLIFETQIKVNLEVTYNTILNFLDVNLCSECVKPNHSNSTVDDLSCEITNDGINILNRNIVNPSPLLIDRARNAQKLIDNAMYSVDRKHVFKNYFEQDIQNLESFLGLNLDFWKY